MAKPTAAAARKRKDPPKSSNTASGVADSVDVVLPPSLFSNSNSGGDCSVLVQIEPRDATVLDFEGVSGAIGRFEADEEELTLDLKGFQYSGTIHPGPTAMVVALANKGGRHHLKVDAMTDEFVTLEKTSDVMAKLDAVVVQGSMDDGYNVVEENVNARSNQQQEEEESKSNAKKETGVPSTKKRKTSAKGKKKS